MNLINLAGGGGALNDPAENITNNKPPSTKALAPLGVIEENINENDIFNQPSGGPQM